LSGAEIQACAGLTIDQITQCADVGVRQIGYVNVVTNARTIGRRVIDAENRDRTLLCQRGIEYQGDQVSFVGVRFPGFARLIRSGGVEVAQRHPPDIKRAAVPTEGPFDGQLRLSVRIDGTLGVGLIDVIRFGHSVDGTGG